MPEPEQVHLRVNLGRRVALDQLHIVVADLATACGAAEPFEVRLAIAAVDRQLFRPSRLPPDIEEELFFDVPWRSRPTGPGGYPWPPSSRLNRLRADRLRDYGIPDDVRVEAINYSNPLDAYLVVASGGVVLALLRVLRNWSSDRRIRGALANEAEDAAAARSVLRRHFLDQITSGNLNMPPEWVEDLLTPATTIEALGRLSQFDVTLPELEEGDR